MNPDYLAGMRENLARSQEDHAASYAATVCGRRFTVMPGVFSPSYCRSTEFFTSQVVKMLTSNDSLLEVGTGIGATCVIAAEMGACVTGVEVNQAAFANSLLNVDTHGVADKVKLYLGETYKPLPDGLRYTIIYGNVPFACVERDAILSDLERSVFDPGYQGLAEFVSGAPERLVPGGVLLIGFSSTLGDENALGNVACATGLTEFKTLTFVDHCAASYPISYDLHCYRLG